MSNKTGTPDIANPDWLPSDAEELGILARFSRRVAWERAMAAQGIRIHDLRLTPEETQAKIEDWARDNAETVAPVRSR